MKNASILQGFVQNSQAQTLAAITNNEDNPQVEYIVNKLRNHRRQMLQQQQLLQQHSQSLTSNHGTSSSTANHNVNSAAGGNNLNTSAMKKVYPSASPPKSSTIFLNLKKQQTISYFF
jgi:hypothetical protein